MRKFRKRRFICLIFLFVFLINTFSVFATQIGNYVSDLNTTNDNCKTLVYDNMSFLGGKLNNSYTGIKGYYYNLGLYLSYGTWLTYLDGISKQENVKRFGVSAIELSDYCEGFNGFIKNFNVRFKEDEELKLKKITPVILVEYDLNNNSNFKNCYNKTVSNSFKSSLDNIKGMPTNISDANYKNQMIEFDKKYKTELRNMYESLTLLYSSFKEIDNCVPRKYNSDSNEVSHLFEFDDVHSGLNTLWYGDLFIKEPYKSLLAHGKDLFNSDTEGLHGITSGKGNALQIFYNDKDKKFESSYYAVVATSSIYKPFRDKLGNSEFKTSLTQLMERDTNPPVSGEKIRDIINAYDKLKDYKKPLYRRPWNGETVEEGSTATPVSCKDFFSSITSASSSGGALVHIKQPFYLGKDTNSTGYFEEGDIVVESNKPNSGDKPKEDSTNQSQDSNTENDGNTEGSAVDPVSKVDKKDGFSLLDYFCKTVYAQPVDNPEQPTTGEQNNSSPSQNGTKTEVNKTTNIKSDNLTHGANDPITDNSIMSDPVFLYGSETAGFTGALDGDKVEMGNILINNIIKDNPGSKNILNSNALLYINPFGDIVLSDNTVILPASANPYLFYNGYNYYIGTKAFMQSYPSLLSNKDGNKFEVSNPRDVGKYLLGYFQDVYGPSSYNDLNASRGYTSFATRITDSKSVDHSFKRTMNIVNMTSDSIKNSKEGSLLELRTFDFKEFISSLVDEDVSYLLRDTTSNGDFINSKLFGYYENKEQAQMNRMITRNFYWYLTTNSDGISDVPNDRLKADKMHEILTSASSGTTRTETFEKNRIIDSELVAQSGFGRIKKTFADLSKDIFNFYGDSKGVLGLLDGSQDNVFSFILYVLDKYLIYILAVILIFLIFRYMKQVTSLAYMFGSALIVTGFYYLALTIIPYYIPSIYNFSINSTTSNLTNNVIALKSEQYKDVVLSKFDSSGRVIDNTCSITLYKCNKDQAKEICETYDVEWDDHLKGKVVNIDLNNGIFLEGYNIKCSVDKLFSGIPIVGSNNDLDGLALNYNISAKKLNSSSIDYYTPFNSIVSNFTDNLNKFSRCLVLERSTLSYPQRGLEKDSFLIYNYLRSSVVLNPGDFSYEESYLDIECCEALKEYFGDSNDWLGMSKIFNNPSQETKDSLWYKTLEKNGFLEKTEESKERLSDLIDYVNYHTRLLLLDLGNATNFMSDENLIKIISLNATMLLNQKASDYGNYMYPISLNTEELNYKDVALAMLSDDTEAFMIQNNHPVDQVISKYGLFSLIIFDIASVESFLIARIIQYFVVFLYVAFLVILFIRFTTNSEQLPLIRGYLKCSIITFVCYLIFMLSLNLTYKFNNTAFCLWFMFIVFSFILKFIFTTIWHVLEDLSVLGDNTVKLDPKSVLDGLGLGRLPFINNLNVGNIGSRNIFRRHNNIDNIVFNKDYEKYRYDSYYDSNSNVNYSDNEGYFYDPSSGDIDEDSSYDNEDIFN